MTGRFKLLLLAACLFSTAVVQGQPWTRVTGLPVKEYFSLEVFDNTMYAGATDTLYISKDKGNSWSAKKLPGSGYVITAVTVYNGRIYAGTSNGVQMSGDGGNNWAPSNINLGINSFAQWNGFLYAGTDGGGVFRCTQISNTWSPFNQNYPVSISGGVMRLLNIGHTLFAAAGMNGAGYRYDTAAAQWAELFYLGTNAPGMAVFDLAQNDSGHVFALNNSLKMLRSYDSGTHWALDSTDMRQGIDGVMLKASKKYYVAWNAGSGTWLQQRDISEPAGSSWAAGEEFLSGNVVYAMREYDRRLFLARNDGVYFKANGSGAVSVAPVAAKDGVMIYPNPSDNGAITIQAPGMQRLEVRDMSGRLVHEAVMTSEGYRLQLSSAGIYVVRLSGKAGVVRRKVIVR